MVKPFAFGLEKVLEYRRQLEDEAKIVLSRAMADHEAQQRMVDGLEARLAAHSRSPYRDDDLQPGAGDIWLWQQYKEALERDIIDAKADLARLALILQKCRRDAVEKSKERKLLEKLKENQAKKYYAEANEKERKEFDEMATIRFEPEDF